MTAGLLPSHRKLLARLVAKYGRRVIAEAAMKVRTPRSGPPSTADRWEDVVWIEERADELGRRYGAVKQATAERFAKVTPHKRQSEAAFRKFAKRVKNARGEWSKVERVRRAEEASRRRS